MFVTQLHRVKDVSIDPLRKKASKFPQKGPHEPLNEFSDKVIHKRLRKGISKVEPAGKLGPRKVHKCMCCCQG